MSRQVRFTFRIDERLDFNIALLSKKNNMSKNKFMNYILEIGLNEYLKKYERNEKQ